MNRETYFNYIEEKIDILATRINRRGTLNLLELNIHSENFFANLLNIIFEWKLKNLNEIKSNNEGIDLVDEENKIVIQVSSTATTQKLDNSLKKKIYENYIGYNFKFISISKEFKLKDYNVPTEANKLKFDFKNDIIDIRDILNIILNIQSIVKLKKLYDFIKSELGEPIDIQKIDTNLAAIINILSEEDFSKLNEEYEINSFEIEKKIVYNNLDCIRDIIDDFKIYYGKINEKYELFDQCGKNKSLSVLQTIRNQYILLSRELSDESEIFLKVIEKIRQMILESSNYKEIPFEELEFCINILVVDAFIKCKIFKNPEGYEYAITR